MNDLDHAFDGHGFFGDDEAAIRICGGKVGFESGPLHGIGGSAVTDGLLFVDSEDRRKKRIIVAQNQSVVEVLQDMPGSFFDFVAWEDHVYSGIDGIFDFDGELSGVTVQILRFAFEVVEAVGILKVKMGNASHSILLLLYVEA